MEDITLSGFGDILKAYRKQRKISQQELASHLDLHRNTIGVLVIDHSDIVTLQQKLDGIRRNSITKSGADN